MLGTCGGKGQPSSWEPGMCSGTYKEAARRQGISEGLF